MTKLRWRYGILAGIFLAVFALYPQLKLLYLQGSDWQGHYAYNDIDEVAYAAYLKALIDGRPRKNDPYTGRDQAKGSPQPESLFSIQFAAPYSVALPARVFGVSAPTAMTASGAMAGFLTALGCFWLVGYITRDSTYAFAGTLVVLCGGALAAGEGAIGEILGTGVSYPYFPFLRRYLPAVPFPVFFCFLAAVWLMVSSTAVKKQLIWGAIACVSFAFLVFSYFYIWTTAAAWLACLAIVWIAIRPRNWLENSWGLLGLSAACFVPLAIYGYLLSQRSETLDQVQLLVFTRQPDLFRFPEYIAAIVLVIIVAGVLAGRIDIKRRSTIFAISLALVPFVVFNQQVITGRSLQPIHYQVFIGNYVAALSLVVAVGLLWRDIDSQRSIVKTVAAMIVSLSAVIWGFVECHYTVRVLDQANVIRDQGMPLAAELRKLADGNREPYRSTILSIGTIHSDDSPTVAPQNVLWARHQHIFPGLSWQESKDRYYRYLYYQNLDERWLERRLTGGDFVSMIALFGWARHSNRLSFDAKPLTRREINDEVLRFKSFRQAFSIDDAANPELSFVVIPKDWDVDFTNIDRWYERDEGRTVGIYKLFSLKLKDE